MIASTDAYFQKGCGRCARFDTADCSTRLWARGLADLRRICLGVGLAETAKWGHPCYMHAGRNIAIIGAFRSDFRLTFFNAALMTDPGQVLQRQGPNVRHADMIRFTDSGQPGAQEVLITAYLREAMSYAAAGIKPPQTAAEVTLPDELIDALDGDPDLAEAFQLLTPGRQRSYVIALSSAKRPETRAARIDGFRARILAGKAATD